MANETTQSNLDTILGRLVVEQGLASSEDIEETLRLKRESEEKASEQSLATLLVENGIVTQRQLERLRPRAQEEQEQQNRSQQIPGYQIIKRLGSGAMATVYQARQLSLDRMVAIKVLPRKYTNNKEFVERFYAEGRAAAKLNHPNIVQAYDVGQAGDFHYFVMEYVEGHTVFDDISSGQPYPEERALEIAIQVIGALAHAHKAGFIHRDVKPKNIMLTPDGMAKLADMGLARAISDVEAAEAEAGKAFGTPYYISPEQIRGVVDVDYRADVYGLGATLYHMVTGRVPFDGPNPSAVMHKHLKADLVPPDHINSSLSAGLGEIIEVCMAKDRKERYRSTSDLLSDLEAVRRGEAPLQARKTFDLASLQKMEETAISDSMPGPYEGEAGSSAMLYHPAFWAAAAGWLVALILFIILLAGV